MSFKSCLKSLLTKQKQPSKRKRAGVKRSKLSFESLETRNLLATLSFNPAEGILRVTGDSLANVGEVQQINSTTVRASVDNLPDLDVNSAQVQQIIFLGFGGDDQFTNNTDIEGLLLGFNGNDTLIGGSGFDQINGGAGNDLVRGSAGNDRLIGGNGDDTIFGDSGTDSIFGGDGTNTLRGGTGDDIIFGGNNVDTIFGEAGIDQIFGLAGDDILDAGAGGIEGTQGIGQADLVLGLDGDDTITGLSGLNVLYGGNGNDTIIGGSGENRLHGQNGDDVLTGGGANDFIAGHLGNDTINAGAGFDFILPGFGDDSVDGGAGTDFVTFSRGFSEFMITGAGSALESQDRFDIEGDDSLNQVERFRFSDGDRNAVSGVTKTFTVQPIIVSNSDGSNTSEFFGNAEQEDYIKRRAEFILYQAGIDLIFLEENTLNNTFVNVGDGGTRPNNDLESVVSIGDRANVSHSNANFANVYFVEQSPGFDDLGENFAYGLAFVDGNGVTFSVGDNLVEFRGGQNAVASVFAHEVGHNLGLDHVDAEGNLMAEGEIGDFLNNTQIATILGSRFTLDI